MGWKAGLLRCNSARPELGQAKHGQHAECWKQLGQGWLGWPQRERTAWDGGESASLGSPLSRVALAGQNHPPCTPCARFPPVQRTDPGPADQLRPCSNRACHQASPGNVLCPALCPSWMSISSNCQFPSNFLVAPTWHPSEQGLQEALMCPNLYFLNSHYLCFGFVPFLLCFLFLTTLLQLAAYF